MEAHFTERLAPLRIGILFSLLTLLFGFGLGAAFGAAEDGMKGYLSDQADAVLADAYAGDAAEAMEVTDKSWTYLKRAHLHANGLGTSALAMILLLSFLGVPGLLQRLVAAGLGVGALGYSLFWLLAGMRAPGMGSTGAAKESLQWLATPSSGLCILGLLAVIVLLIGRVARR